MSGMAEIAEIMEIFQGSSVGVASKDVKKATVVTSRLE